MQSHHITISSNRRRALARGEEQLRGLVRAVVQPCRERLQLFSVVDDHVHVVPRTSAPRVLARDVVRAIRVVLPGVELDPPHVRPVASRSHHLWLVKYMLSQPTKHGLSVHPALWTGSCFQDLVGARLLPGYDLTALRQELPRLRVRDLMECVGLSVEPIVEATDDELRQAGVARILSLAAGVYALSPQLTGRSQDVITARALAVHVAKQVGFRPGAIIPFLSVSPRTMRRLTSLELDPRAAVALRRRLSLEERARSSS